MSHVLSSSAFSTRQDRSGNSTEDSYHKQEKADDTPYPFDGTSFECNRVFRTRDDSLDKHTRIPGNLKSPGISPVTHWPGGRTMNGDTQSARISGEKFAASRCEIAMELNFFETPPFGAVWRIRCIRSEEIADRRRILRQFNRVVSRPREEPNEQFISRIRNERYVDR